MSTEGGATSAPEEGPKNSIGAQMYTRDLGFLPIPKRLRYDPDRPPHFGLLLNISFGFASTFGESFGTLIEEILTDSFYESRR